MSERVWAYVDTGWRGLLVVAVVAYGVAALATEVNANAFARFAGTAAWACAAIAAVAGLVIEFRRSRG